MRNVGTYFSALWDEAGLRVAVTIVASAVAALAEGVLLLMLAPLLSLAGLTGQTAMTGALSRTLQSFGLFDLQNRIGETGLIGLWIAAAIVVTVLSSFREMEAPALQERFMLVLRRRFQAAAMGADWMALQRERSSDLVAVISDTLTRAGEGVVALIQFAARMLAVIVQIAIAVAVAPGPCVVALGVGLLLMPFQVVRLRRAFRKGREVMRGQHTVQAIVSDHIAAIKLAKAHGAERGLTDHFVRTLDDLRARRLGLWQQRVLARSGFRISALLGLALVIWISVTKLGAAGPALLVLIAVFARLVPALTEVLQHAHMSAEALAAWAEAEQLFRRLDAVAEPKVMVGIACPTGTIVFEGVSLTWPGRAEPAVRDMDFRLEHRRTTAIVGPSGAGKSTVADLALGLLVPSGGRILVGGVALEGASRAAWHQGSAYVPQSDVLFHDSLRANLLWARPDADEAALRHALQTAALDETVDRLPEGIDTVLGDRGSHLSGGERQRVALARALLRDPSFLVLDEATSHLDNANERLIQDALNRLQHSVTMLVIAHRLETIRQADHIIVVEAGRVTDQGTWDALLTRPGSWLARTVGGQVPG
ncbi:MAG TPA: ABC transporter ATP-binding protein [Aliidongia sp.]|uniref:ABC transporter ATP-binding protein n=1 Tax=Aliidongia sp. TaxID=1914230 RepID=UPI002DDD53A8|nr:ABC transporter ATP-binding protein [Aliidongia sp.]HEV2674594.1 ABC transporter ATP-binding protein [Aliidongia sp.]